MHNERSSREDPIKPLENLKELSEMVFVRSLGLHSDIAN